MSDQPNPSERLCINCANFAPNNPKQESALKASLRGNVCLRASGRINLTDGTPEYETFSTSWERLAGWLASRLEGTCGKEGRFFKPINQSGREKA